MLITGNRHSYVVYTGDGSTAIFSVPFPYLHKSYITVTVDKVTLPPGHIEWLSHNSIRLLNPPKQNAIVRIQRITENDHALVDYTDGSVLTEEDLDTNTTQLLHLVQEAWDIAGGLKELLEILATWEGGLALFYQVQMALALVYDFLRRADPGFDANARGDYFCGGAQEEGEGETLISCNGAGDGDDREHLDGGLADSFYAGGGGSGDANLYAGIILGGGGACGFAPPDSGGSGEPPSPDPGPDGKTNIFCGNAPDFIPAFVILCGDASTITVKYTYSGGNAPETVADAA